jgi:hypothetical protein
LNWIVDGKRPHPLGGTVSACTALASAARRRSMSGSGPILLPALAAYWQKLLGTLTSQAEEVRALVTKVAAAAGEPLKAQVQRGVDELRKAN